MNICRQRTGKSAMSLYDPYDADRPLRLNCACGAHGSAAEHAAALLRGHRRHADDGAAAARAHVGNHRLRHVQRAAQHHAGDEVVVLGRDIDHPAPLGDLAW